MRLAELVDSVPPAQRDIWIERVVAESRYAGPGALFTARKGTRADGNSFIAEAVRAECAAIVGGSEPPPEIAGLLRSHRVPYVGVADPAQAVGEIAARANGRSRVAFYGQSHEALLPWSLERCDERGTIIRIADRRVRTRLLGEHNASNTAAAITTASLLGADLEGVVRAIPRLRGARPHATSRVATGARDRRLRAHAGKPRAHARERAQPAPARQADRRRRLRRRPRQRQARRNGRRACNRSEDPGAIIKAMLGDLGPSEQQRVRIELHRRRAIQRALRLRKPGDILVLVGNGHESSQEIAGTKHAWNDAAELRDALQRRFSLHPAAGRAMRATAN
jgi:UDP-N-acetylmuramyl tripeptide synthase